MTIEERAKYIQDKGEEWANKDIPTEAWYEWMLDLYIEQMNAVRLEALKQQRHACAEVAAAILSTGDKTVIMSQLHQALMNTAVSSLASTSRTQAEAEAGRK